MGFLSSKSAAPPAPVERTPEVKPEVKPDPVEVASAKKSRKIKQHDTGQRLRRHNKEIAGEVIWGS